MLLPSTFLFDKVNPSVSKASKEYFMLLIFATTGFHYLPTRTYQEVYLFTTMSSNLKVANHFKMV